MMTEHDTDMVEIALSPEARSFMLTSAKTELMMPVVEDIYSIGSKSKWFVIYTDPQCEQRACAGLAEHGIESYTPKTRDWRKQSLKDIHQKKPKVEIVRPLLVRYSFVRLPVRETKYGIEIPFGAVRLIEGVREIVGTPEGPITVSDEVVDMIRGREGAGEFDNTIKVAIGKKRSRRGKRSHVHEAPRESKADKETRVPKWVDVDVKARVLNGPFSMLMGVIEEILPNERVKLGIELFGRSTNIEIGIDALTASE